MRLKLRLFISMLLLFLIGTISVLVVGIRRYGSLPGLINRVAIEIDTYRPKPELAPTLIPLATIDVETFAAELMATLPPASLSGYSDTSTVEAIPTQTPLPSLSPTKFVDELIKPTETLVSTYTPPPEETSTSTPLPIYQPIANQVYLDGYRHEWQDWNNCGPATLSTYLSFHGHLVGQETTAPELKPNERDKNVNPEEIVTYVEKRFPDLNVALFYNGDLARLKLLLSNGLPVMLVTWLEESPNDGMGHYRFLVGYDQRTGEWIVSDSFVSEGIEGPYEGIRIANAEFYRLWSIQDRGYILIYTDEKNEIVDAIVGEDMEWSSMLERAIESYQSEILENPADPFAWHTLGELLMELDRPAQAAQAYDQARAIGLPWRMFWYNFQIYEAYYRLGRHQDVVELAEATIEAGGGGRRGLLLAWSGLARIGGRCRC